MTKPTPDTRLRCSMCRAVIADGRGVTFTVSTGGVGRSNVGAYCQTRCATAGRALLALADSIPVRASRELRERRERIGDELLELWRQRRGPDPALVLAAAKRARERDTGAVMSPSYGAIRE